MTWDQIELKWAEMTSRVRTDSVCPAGGQRSRTSPSDPARVDPPVDRPKIDPPVDRPKIVQVA